MRSQAAGRAPMLPMTRDGRSFLRSSVPVAPWHGRVRQPRAAIVALRRKGRTFSYIAEEIGVCRDVIGRGLMAAGRTRAD